VGADLKHEIARVLDIKFEHRFRHVSGDEVIEDAFRRIAIRDSSAKADVNRLLHAAWSIRDAMPQAPSIDNFIDSHRSDENVAICGKLAIARCILTAEAKSKLSVDRSNVYNTINFAGTSDTWLSALFQLISQNCQSHEVAERLSRIAIICFNYDRCIEHYLHSAIRNYYGMNEVDATAAISKLEVHHPYGTVGKLPWQDRTGGVQFGESLKADALISLTKELRTFTEGVDPKSSDIGKIRLTLQGAKRIAFLGFAYHPLNIRLLYEGVRRQPSDVHRKIFATAYGLSASDVTEITRELSELSRVSVERIHLRNDLKCAQLFSEYRRGMSVD